MDAKTYFTENLPKMLAESPDNAKELDAVFYFNVTGDGGGEWTVDLKADPPVVNDGKGDFDCGMTLSNEDFAAILDNFQLSMQYFFEGRLQVDGDPMLATKLQVILEG